MPETDIPKRALFKSSEVCEIASVQPYVLRSWESEFPDLGVSKDNGGPRVYRRADVERVLRIKQLVFSDGLTLAGVRRRIDEEAPARLEEPDAPPPVKHTVSRSARERLIEVKKGLRDILGILSSRPRTAALRLQGPQAPSTSRPTTRGKAQARRAKPSARPVRKTNRSRR